MPNVSKTTATYTGFPGAPGYTTLHWEELTTPAAVDAAVLAHRTFLNGFASTMKTTWRYDVSPVVQTYDVGSSTLIGESVSTNPPAAVVGTGLTSASYAGGTGLMVSWLTGLIWEGRNLRGRTYLVPLQNINDPDGTLLGSAITAAQGAANILIGNSAAHLAVWGKRYDRTTTPPTQVAGAVARVAQATVADKAAILRSRRD